MKTMALLKNLMGAAVLAFALAGCGGGGGTSAGGGIGGTGGTSCTSVVPTAPTLVYATAGNASASVSWWPPSNVTVPANYVVTSSPGNISVVVPGIATSTTVNGLTNGTSYTFTVIATTCAGTSPASTPSNAVVPSGPPSAPTGVTAVLGAQETTMSVGFNQPSNNGGSAIYSYTVTSSPGNIQATGTTSPIVVGGLSNNTTYTFTVTATNLYGTGPSSSPSNSVLESIAYTGPFYVSASAGLDSNNGASGTPFKTISQALAVTKSVNLATGNTVNIAAGAYTVGETFPMMMQNKVNLIGAGSGTTTIVGSNWYTVAATGSTYGANLVFPPGVSATVQGLGIGNGWDTCVIVDGGTATLKSDNIDGTIGNQANDGLYVFGNSTVTLTGNIIKGWNYRFGGLYVNGNATVSGMGNAFTDSGKPAINVVGGGTAANSPVINLGTAATPGGNTITGPGVIGGLSGSVGLNVTSTLNMVNVSGNTWHANVQGASATGTYTAGGTATGTVGLVIGNNYAISTSSGLQF